MVHCSSGSKKQLILFSSPPYSNVVLVIRRGSYPTFIPFIYQRRYQQTMTLLQAIFFTVFVISGTTLGAVNGPCSVDGTPGVCISTASCSDSDGSFRSGFCPNDPSDIKCCTKPDCGAGGNCRWTSQCSGTSQAGLCPGPADFKCCLKSDGGSPGGGTSTSHDLSANGVKFIESFEGWNANFYVDSAVKFSSHLMSLFSC